MIDPERYDEAPGYFEEADGEEPESEDPFDTREEAAGER